MERLKHWLRLKNAPDLGYQTSLKLLYTFGDPWRWTEEQLESAFQQRLIVRSAYEHLQESADPPGWQEICKYMESCELRYTTLLDPDYPALLKGIYSPPLALYIKGSCGQFWGESSLGVVGTRKPSDYGRSMTRMIVADLARSGITIVSGLAYGIDTCAHAAALEGKGKTIAVLAHGLESIYPPQNRKLAEQIMSNGALVSEYEPGSKMERWNFPARNRIISGLSRGVFVTEGAITSGALLTAKFALEQNRDVYALPGQINLSNAQGPNHLLKNGARLVTGAEDILLDFGIDTHPAEQTDLFPELNTNEQTIYDIFSLEQREIGFDELVLKTGFSIGQLSITLLNLELKDMLLKVQGGAYALR